ncbi:MAG: hypothetical protein KGL44_09050 [Sphingomonadales bacterium]|nr:hypothetical protein [Sphingomonadales bacterium]
MTVGADFLHNVDAEAAVLGAIMTDTNDGNPTLVAIGAMLEPAHFFEPVHRRIYSACVEVVAQGRPANPVTLKNRFQDDAAMRELGGASYLARLTGECGFLAPLPLAEEIRELATRRFAIAAIADIARPLGHIAGDLAEAIAARKAVFDAGFVKEHASLPEPPYIGASVVLADDLIDIFAGKIDPMAKRLATPPQPMQQSTEAHRAAIARLTPPTPAVPPQPEGFWTEGGSFPVQQLRAVRPPLDEPAAPGTRRFAVVRSGADLPGRGQIQIGDIIALSFAEAEPLLRAGAIDTIQEDAGSSVVALAELPKVEDAA